MSRPQLNIKFDGEGEKEFLDAVKQRAEQERISLKEFVIDALRNRLSLPAQSTQSTQTTPSPNNLSGELRRRISECQVGLMGEIHKDREQISILAAAIAQLESRLDKLDPPAIEASQNTQASQNNWENNAVEFLDTIKWGE